MTRRLLNLLTLLSLLLCVALSVLWLRSSRVIDRLVWSAVAGPEETRRSYIASGRGAVWFGRDRIVRPMTLARRLAAAAQSTPARERHWERSTDPRDNVRPAALSDDLRKWVGFPSDESEGAWLGFVHGEDTEESDVPLLPAACYRSYTAIPYWMPLTAAACLPAARLVHRSFRGLRRRLRRAGHCPSCGYDLRATPDRCPECGGTGPARGSM